MKVLLLVVLFASVIEPLHGTENLFDIKPVIDGVYAAIPRRRYITNSNSVIIILSDGVLVVDSQSQPSMARALILQIRTITDKPVKYLVNTHLHFDHTRGNQAYVDAWPSGLEIISTEATREAMELKEIPRLRHDVHESVMPDNLPNDMQELRDELKKATDDKRRAEINEDISQAEAYLEEQKSTRVTLPTVTFDRTMIIHDKMRTVELLWLGRGHTDGDAFVYLPRERFLATGDALLGDGWQPFMADSYPYDWIHTLEAAEKLDIEYVVGGHGDVLRGKGQFHLWENYLRDLMSETAEAYAEGQTLEETKQDVAAQLLRKYKGKMGLEQPKDLEGSIEKAYQVVSFKY